MARFLPNISMGIFSMIIYIDYIFNDRWYQSQWENHIPMNNYISYPIITYHIYWFNMTNENHLPWKSEEGKHWGHCPPPAHWAEVVCHSNGTSPGLASKGGGRIPPIEDPKKVSQMMVICQKTHFFWWICVQSVNYIYHNYGNPQKSKMVDHGFWWAMKKRGWDAFYIILPVGTS